MAARVNGRSSDSENRTHATLGCKYVIGRVSDDPGDSGAADEVVPWNGYEARVRANEVLTGSDVQELLPLLIAGPASCRAPTHGARLSFELLERYARGARGSALGLGGATRGARAWPCRQLDRRRVHRAQPHLAPGHALLDQRRHAHQDRGRDLDGLQDHAIGHAHPVADMPPGVQDRGARRLEHAEVGGRGRQHRRDVDGEQNRRGGRPAGLLSSPSATRSM